MNIACCFGIISVPESKDERKKREDARMKHPYYKRLVELKLIEERKKA